MSAFHTLGGLRELKELHPSLMAISQICTGLVRKAVANFIFPFQLFKKNMNLPRCGMLNALTVFGSVMHHSWQLLVLHGLFLFVG